MAIRAPDGAKNSHILPTGQWYAPSAVNYSTLSCTILHYLALSCTILHYLALSCTISHSLVLSCTILHIRYTCSQQMSPVIAFDIAVVAQKVKVQLLYNGRYAKSEKVG